MGTRSLTVFQEQDGTEIVVMYRQYDGYPTGHGQDLKDFLEPFTVVNGISRGENRKVANGAGCLAAQAVAHFKKEAGGFYLYPAGARDCGEEYIYTVRAEVGTIHLKVEAGCVMFFGLPGTKQKDMPVLYNGPISDFDPAAAEQVERDSS